MARHLLRWSQAKVLAASNDAEAFPLEIETALSENEAADFTALKRLLRKAAEFVAGTGTRA